MAEPCNWIIFYAHPTRLAEEDEHPEFYGVFICPVSRRDPEVLMEEVLVNRKLFLAQIVEQRVTTVDREWGINERLKAEVERSGYGLSVTKLQRNVTLEG